MLRWILLKGDDLPPMFKLLTMTLGNVVIFFKFYISPVLNFGWTLKKNDENF